MGADAGINAEEEKRVQAYAPQAPVCLVGGVASSEQLKRAAQGRLRASQTTESRNRTR